MVNLSHERGEALLLRQKRHGDGQLLKGFSRGARRTLAAAFAILARAARSIIPASVSTSAAPIVAAGTFVAILFLRIVILPRRLARPLRHEVEVEDHVVRVRFSILLL